MIRPELFAHLEAHSLDSFSKLAFAVGTPQVAPSQAEVEAFVRRVIVDEEPAIALVSDVRKLIFEASTYVLAELKMQVSAPEVGEVSRKIPFVEKRARLQEQQARLGGLKIEGNMCPSHALIDPVYGMAVSGAIVYLPPSKCGSRDQEVAGDNKAKPIIKFENSQLTVVPGDALEPIDVGSELKCLWALQRRGIAFDQAEILSWDVHESWVHKLFNTLSQEVPAGFGRVSLAQVLRADRELFVLMTQEISDPLRPAAGSPKPMDAALQRLITDPRLMVYLTPVQQSAKQIPSVSTRKETVKVTHATQKRKDSAGSIRGLPDELKGLESKDAQGRPRCWHHNCSHGCKNPLKKGRCRFGYHHCMKCGATNHGASTCNKS